MRNMCESSDGKKSVHSALSSKFHIWEKYCCRINYFLHW